MTPLDHAVTYARWGWRVAPIPPGAKYPKDLPEWQRVATTDEATIGAWWTSSPTHGVSIVTGVESNLFVVDVDPRHGGDETLADLEHEHGNLPDTVEVITGGGGRHIYFRMPSGQVIANDAGKRLGPGLDVRGEGGQVVAPPSIHPDTDLPYTWEASNDPFDGCIPVQPPAWLIELLTAIPAALAPRRPQRTGVSLSDRPGDRFEHETDWADLLQGDGWTLHSARRGRDGDYELWTRPGKDPRDGASASLYYQGGDVLKVFTSSVPGLDPGATYTRFGYLAATKHAGDHQAAARELGRRYESSTPRGTTDKSENSTVDEIPRQRPEIVHNGRQLDTVTAHAISALEQANTPPRYFVRAGQLARLREDEEHRPLIEGLRNDTARLALADAATWWRSLKDGALTATSPPIDVAASVLARGTWPLPALAGVVELPVLRPDGTFHTDHGYDSITRLFHWHHGAPYPPIPDTPTPGDVQAAVELIDEALHDFPWDTTSDRANTWALLLTPLIRPLVRQVPMALVDAPEPGTGKGLLVKVISIITTGRSVALQAWPTTEEELQKSASATLMAGATMIVYDNVEGMIRSPNLAAILTADTWQGRVLGRSEIVSMPNQATWVATGNNIDVGGDLARRCYRIRLDAHQAQPWKRSGFKHPDLEGWTTNHRPQLLHALCTIVRSWHTTGRPLATAIAAMGGYTQWVRIVGGILDHAGVTGFLANLDEFHAGADQEARQWEGFLTAWLETYGEESITTGELVAKVRDQYHGFSLREALPEDLAGHVDGNTFPQRLGKALRRRANRHYGDGIHIVEMPRDRRQIAIWAVTTRSMRLFEGAGVESTPARPDSSTWDDADMRGSRGSDLLPTREKKLSTDEKKGSGDPNNSRDSRTPARTPNPDIDPTTGKEYAL